MNEELKNFQDLFNEVITNLKQNINNIDLDGIKESIGDVSALNNLLKDAGSTYLRGFNAQLETMSIALQKSSTEAQQLIETKKAEAEAFEKIQGIIEDFGSKFDSVVDKATDIVKKIPIIGDSLYSIISEQASNIKTQLSDNLKLAFADGKLSLENFKSASIASFQSIGTFISSTMKAVLSNPLILAAALVIALGAAAFSLFSKLDSAGENFRKSTGLTANISKDLENSAYNTYTQYSKYGVTLESAGEAAKSLLSEFNSVNDVTKDMVGTISVMADNFGLAAEDGAKVLKTFMSAGPMSSAIAQDLMFAAKGLSDAAGVPFPAVMKDIAENAEFVYTYFKGSGQEMVKAAVSAARLGSSLSSMAGSVESILDFQSSIEKQMKASAMTGKMIDLSYARQLAYQGKMVDYQNEILRQVNSIGNFDSMNYLQKKAVAEAMGYSVSEMSKMIDNQKIINEMSAKERAEYEAALGVVNDLQKVDKERMLEQAQQQAVMSKLGNQLSAIWIQLSKVLLPIVNIIAIAIEYMAIGIGFIVDNIKSLFSEGGKLYPLFNSLGNLFSSLWTTLVSIGKYLSIVLIPTFALLLPIISIIKFSFNTILDAITYTITLVTSAIKIIGGLFDIIYGSIIGIFTGDFSLVNEGINTIIDGIKLAFNGVIEYLKNIVNNIYDLITWPFVQAWDFLFGNTVWSGETIAEVFNAVINVLKEIGGMIIDIITWPYVKAWELIENIPFVGDLIGGDSNDKSASIEKPKEKSNELIESNNRLEKKLDQVIMAIQGMELSMDGKKVGKVIVRSTSPAVSTI